MKKIIFLLMLGALLTACEDTKVKDYSEYPFTEVVWTRNAEHDEETIIFKADGSFRYYCACGNPVNDSDLCETFTYDDKTKEIKLDCFEETEETISKIKIEKVSEDSIELSFDGETRKFEKEKETEK